MYTSSFLLLKIVLLKPRIHLYFALQIDSVVQLPFRKYYAVERSKSHRSVIKRNIIFYENYEKEYRLSSKYRKTGNNFLTQTRDPVENFVIIMFP